MCCVSCNNTILGRGGDYSITIMCVFQYLSTANNKYSSKMHGWLYSCLAGVNFVESLIFQRRGESLYHTCSLYDKWYPAMLFLTLVVMAYWGASGWYTQERKHPITTDFTLFSQVRNCSCPRWGNLCKLFLIRGKKIASFGVLGKVNLYCVQECKF